MVESIKPFIKQLKMFKFGCSYLFRRMYTYKKTYLLVQGQYPIVCSNCSIHSKDFIKRTRTGKPEETETISESKDISLPRNSRKSSRPVTSSSELGKIMLIVKSKRKRDESGLIMLEGKRLLMDAVWAGIIPEMIFYSRSKDIEGINLPYDLIKLFKVTYKEINLWSDLVTSPGIIAICKKPSSIPEPKVCLPLTVICDQVREPGNLGAMIRSAAAAGARSIILSKGCADPWDPKVLRGSSGAHFRIPIKQEETWDMIKYFDENISVFLATNSSHSTVDCRFTAPLVPYYSVNYSNVPHSVIVIGGETGLSTDAYDFASHLNGTRITIPLSNNIDSLNNASALSVILFEIKRQKLSTLNTSEEYFVKEHIT